MKENQWTLFACAEQKLQSQQGASIVIALVFFLICIMVATTVLGFAGANVERTKQNIADAQAYQALESASELTGPDGFIGTEQDLVNLRITKATRDDDFVVTETTNELSEWIIQETKKVWQAADGKSTYSPTPKTMTITTQNPNNQAPLPQAEATYTMDQNFVITVQTRLTDSSLIQYGLTRTISPKTSGYTVDSQTGEVAFDYPFSVDGWGKKAE